MRELNLYGKKILVVGLARTGLATTSFLKERGSIKSNEEFSAKIEEFEGTETYMDRGEEDKKKAKKRRFKR